MKTLFKLPATSSTYPTKSPVQVVCECGAQYTETPVLLALVLNTVKATALLTYFRTLKHLSAASLSEIQSVKGITKRDAALVQAIFVLNVRAMQESIAGTIIRQPCDVFDAFQWLSLESQEQFVVVCMNTKNKIIAWRVISEGTLNAAIVHPRDVFHVAIEQNSASVIVMHNHPSGDPTPSPEDIDITKKLCEVGKVMGIVVFDHIIIGGGRFCSLKELHVM